MHLKTLTLRGFKSFASATTLKFEPGITCVVGPNGSGKSNVVDALAWVMGEQGAKALRGGNMADVVFAGTSSRPALGRAEVSLTIDNVDGALPIDYSEVTISRTLFRSGGSEYAINGTPCRLLDIQELLSDTGMGRQMHVIVGQGQLDAVLHATPEDRRGFIEEAAGVLKHRRRKDKALRKLETMAANLNRLEDLTAEIRRQLGPLARQADVARRAQVIQAELRDAKSRLYADDYAQLGAQLAAEFVGERELAEERAAAQAEVTRLRTWLADMETGAAELAPRVRSVADTVVALSTLRERLDSIHTLARERARFLDAPPPTHGGPDPDELDRQAAHARAAETELHGEQAAAEQALAVASTGREATEAAEREAEHRLAAVHRGVADRREGLARLAGQVAARESRIEAARAEQGRLTESLEAANQRAGRAETQYTALEREIAAQGESGGDLEQAHAAALAAAEAADKRAKELAEAERAERSAAQVARAQLEALALSLGRKDGTAQLAADGFADALIEQAITVAEPWRAAIAAALGEFADAALTSDRDAALAALAHARRAGSGRVRVVHAGGGAADARNANAAADAAQGLQAVRGMAAAQELREAGSGKGVQAALDVVEVKDDVHQAAVAALLADTVLVAELADAAALTAAHPQLRVVTAAGDVLHGARAIGGGAVTGSPIELQGRYDEAAAARGAAEAAATRLKAERAQADAAAEAARRAVAATLSAVRSADAQAAQANQKLAQLSATLRSAQAEVERSEPAIARLNAELDAHGAELAELRERLVVAEKEPQEAEADLAAAQEARDGAAQSATEARRAETDARLQLRTVQERIAALAGRAKQLEEAAGAERTTRRRAEERYRRREAAAHVADQVRADADAALQAIAISLDQAQMARDDAEAAQAQYHRELTGVRSSIDAATTRLTEATDAAHREELARAELTMRLESLAERIREELAVDADTLVEEFGPHLPIVELATDEDGEEARVEHPYVREQQEKRFRRAERDVARLGRINPLALEEHAALNERHEFLTSQVADIKKSRADLLVIVREIDERVERVFAGAYTDTAREFETVFDRLFPGGEGRLVLTDPDDMLTTGIEVEARPAGKKVKRLSLLSGGERSLTAIALLVAIFKARPSPFYVMDEVEAALDDRNLDRLLGIFTELQRDSQLIVITHQKRTMEVADALYGVSMRDGVSAVISQRL